MRYRTFGKILDREIDLHDGLNIFFGDNESGKSTIFNSVYTALFGFNPPNREKHPYINWEKNEIVFSAEICNLKELFLIERSLKSVPKLNVVNMSNGSVQALRNEPLPFINHVSEGMFKKVFYLSSEDLNSIEKETWETVQEKLIFNYGSDYLQKTSDVLSTIEQEINSLWRKDKRGNPLINQLLNDIGQLKLKRAVAEDCYDLLKSEIENMTSLKNEHISIEQMMKDKELELRQLRKILPIKELEEKIQMLKKKIYKKVEFDRIDATILFEIKNKEEVLSKLKSKCDQLIENISDIKLQLVPLTAHDKKLFNLSSELDTLKSKHYELMRLEQEEHSKLEDMIKMSERINSQYRLLFGVVLDDETKVKLKKIQVLDLISLLQKYTEGLESNQSIQQQNMLQESVFKKYNYLFAVIGIVLTVAGFVFKPVQILSFIGIGILGYSIANLLPIKRIHNFELVDLNKIHHQVTEATYGINLPEYVFREDSQRFLSKLEQLITLLFEEEVLIEKREQILTEKHILEEQLEDLLKRDDIDTSRGVRLTLQFVLLQIDSLIESEEIERHKKLRLQHETENLEKLESEYELIKNELDQMYKIVANFGEGNLQMGHEMILYNFELQNSIKVFQEELNNYNYDSELISKLDGLDIERLEEEIIAYQTRSKIILEQIMEKNATILNLKSKVNLDEIESELLFNEELLRDSIKRRDELMIAYEIIKWSDEQFRVKNQPNIIHRVSYFMSIMTNKKYSQVLVKEDNNQFELQFLVNGELMSANLAFSKGTIQQLYLAYRLAVIEVLDPENQMPLVLDEALINWDQNRFDETLKILDEISKQRQILFFTCHRALGMRMNSQLSANLIEVIS